MPPNCLPFTSLSLDPAINRHPVMVPSDTSVVEVLAIMSQSRSSCELGEEQATHPDLSDSGGYVLVMQGSHFLGVFTERDIVRLTAAGNSLNHLEISELLVSPPITLHYSPNQDIFTALSILRQHRIRHLPVVDEAGTVIGIVTHDSIRRALQPVNLLTQLRYVRDVMALDVIHAPEESSVMDLARLMANQRISCVVISRSQNEQVIPVGIVTERDVVQFQALELDLLKTTAQMVMSTPLFSLHPQDSLWFAHQEMQRRHVRRLVVTGQQGQLLGIVSQTSLLQVLNPAEMYGVIEVLQQAVEERTTELETTNTRLRQEVAERRRAEEALQQAHDHLKQQVEERTKELAAANEQLLQDILKRAATEKALRESEAQLRSQTTQLEKTLYELKKTQAQLVQTEKMSSLGQLVAGIAHEINNPINFIYGNLSYAGEYVQDLLKLLYLYVNHTPEPAPEVQAAFEEIDLDFISDDLPKLLGSMKAGSNRIRDLVLSLRNFARLDEAQLKFVNIHEGLDSTLLILQNRLEARNNLTAIRIVKDYGNLPLVECFGGQLNQVFMNLLTNAIDALEEKRSSTPALKSSLIGAEEGKDTLVLPSRNLPQIQISTEMWGKTHVAIRIIDNGMGMTERVHSKLFDPFFTTKPVGKGTGLGLSISYQIIVEKHGGRLYCNSTPEQGSEFVIEIPIRQSQNPSGFAIA